ncbi:hypothetical protein VSS37_08940 [Candidatus Thiothrix sp. Deng01]|uniref:Uncharacterized protein n=1 Tax=Candidatus Thiothrix phosphatis TaxID=3112415 RepID=A0ABU6CW79_9GAMM|nr:hypothetical protein [Candidatus Thiothrix sp. Deng01]MEB4591101.1 hypothetical protein [Candidatus Thiothrix sp. Deng01]
MLRTRLGIGIVVLPLLLSGCGEDANSNKSSPLAEQSAAPALNSYTITAGSAGPVQLGMPSSEILAAMPGVAAGVELDGEGIEWMTLTLNGETLMNVMLDKNTHAASLIRVLSPRFVTEQNVRVGENLQSAGEKLGGLTEIQWTEVESREFATFTNAPASMVFQVISNDGTTAGVYNKGETSTTIASASATIHSIWLMTE